MTRHSIVAVAAAAVLCGVAAAAPQARAVSFVDKQVQAGGLLIQNYINKYGAAHQFTYPPRSMVKKGGGLPDSTLMWPANPWTGKIMAPGASRGTYTYTLGAGGVSYRLTMRLSSGRYVFKGSMPSWLKSERNTASRQNALLLQRYLEDWAGSHRGSYPTAADVSPAMFAEPPHVWPRNPWTGLAMAQGDTLGDFAYTQVGGGASYTLKVMLTSGWSAELPPLSTLARLTSTPGG